VILWVALCWHQKCFKWTILNKEFNRKKILHHFQIQDWTPRPPPLVNTEQANTVPQTVGTVLFYCAVIIGFWSTAFLVVRFYFFLPYVFSRKCPALTWNRWTVWVPRKTYCAVCCNFPVGLPLPKTVKTRKKDPPSKRISETGAPRNSMLNLSGHSNPGAPGNCVLHGPFPRFETGPHQEFHVNDTPRQSLTWTNCWRLGN
jgi:hypothetical protein